jgi:hypothetical protein
MTSSRRAFASPRCYQAHPGLRPALASHARWLREVGIEPARAPGVSAGPDVSGEGSAV